MRLNSPQCASLLNLMPGAALPSASSCGAPLYRMRGGGDLPECLNESGEVAIVACAAGVPSVRWRPRRRWTLLAIASAAIVAVIFSALPMATFAQSIPLGNLFDDAKGISLAQAIATDTYGAYGDEDDLGVRYLDRDLSVPIRINPDQQFDLASAGGTSLWTDFVANDVSLAPGNWPIRTTGFLLPGETAPKIEDGIGMHANNAITFDLDEIRAAGDITADRGLTFTATGAINDAAIGSPGEFLLAVIISGAGSPQAFINGSPAPVLSSAGLWAFAAPEIVPTINGRHPTSVKFEIPILAGARFLTLASISGESNHSDHAVFSQALLTVEARAGDANHDGVVDITDLNLVRNNFGLTGEAVPGDTNDDGTVDIGDLNAVRNNFGTAAGAAAVPEPASALLVICTLFATFVCGRRPRGYMASATTAVLALVSGTTVHASPPRYSVSELPFRGAAINNLGQIAGSLNNVAVVWDSTTGIQFLGDLPGRAITFASRITDNGFVIGFLNERDLDLCSSSWIWDAAAGMRLICDDDFPAEHLFTRDINSSGRAVGIYRANLGQTGTAIPVSWDQVHGVREMEPLTQGLWSDVSSINEAGWAAGNSDVPTSTRATIWRPDGSVVNLGLADASHNGSSAADINDLGYVVVESSGSDTNESWLWHEDTGFLALGSLPGAPADHRPKAINNRNQVLGSVYNEPDGGWLWSAEAGMRRLSDLLASESEGWKIDDPIALNDHGWIVALGRYKNFAGAYPILLTPLPPTPAGDANGDGIVDITDLNLVRNNFGLTGDDIAGDTNDDGTVDIGDLNAVRNNFGASAGAAAVPEPGTMSLFVLIAGVGAIIHASHLRTRRVT